LLQAFGDAFRKAARKQKVRGNAQKAEELAILAEDLGNARQSVESRLHDALSALNEGQFLLLLDNFESNLDESDLHILNPEIASFYRYLLENLSGGSRVIITTRYPPSQVPYLPPKACREDLSDFSQSSFLKILQCDQDVEKRIRSGALPLPLLEKLHQNFGGTPQFLLQIREALKKMDAKVLKAELEQVKLPDTASSGELEKIRDQYFQDIITERLFSYFSPESQKALSQVAVFAVPVILEGLFAVSSVPQESISALAGEWADRAFAYRKPERPLWIVYGLLRPWLLSKLSADERKKAHRAAGDFLMKMEERDRLSEVGLSWADCLLEARFQYMQAGALDQAREVTSRLSSFFVRSGFYDGARHLNFELLQYEEHPTYMSWIGRSFFEQGDFNSAQHWYQRCLSASSAQNLREKGVAFHGLATINIQKGDYIAARDNLENSIKIRQQIGDLAGEASDWHEVAVIDMNRGSYQAAQEKLEKAIIISQQIGDKALEGLIWHGIATIYLHRGNYLAATEMFEKAMIIRQRIGDRAGEGQTWHQLASLDLEQGNYQVARERYEKAMEIWHQIGNWAGEAKALHSLATIDLKNCDYDESQKKFERSLKIKQQIGDRAGEAGTFHQLGFLSWIRGYTQEGLKLVALSYIINKSIGHEKAQLSFESCSAMVSKLESSQESFDAMLKEISESYASDRGWSLIRAAFPET